MHTSQYLAVMMPVLTAISVAICIAFLYQGIEKETRVWEAMRGEKVTLGIPEFTISSQMRDITWPVPHRASG